MNGICSLHLRLQIKLDPPWKRKEENQIQAIKELLQKPYHNGNSSIDNYLTKTMRRSTKHTAFSRLKTDIL